MHDNKQLQQLQEKVSQKKRLEAKWRELHSQQEDLSNRVQELKTVMGNEQADVDRLERTSLTSVFYAVIGKKEDMLDKEKAEVYAAKVKYDSAVQELNLIVNDIHQIEIQLREFSQCEQQYESQLQEKDRTIKASGSLDAEYILQLEEQITAQKIQKVEIREAIAAGSRALRSADYILSSLDTAQNWGTWDLLGGGLISTLAKHSSLDEAQDQVQQLQTKLRRFKTELADVTIHTDMQVNVDGFLRFADYFFDGLFADWAVLDKISQSQSSVQTTKNQIESVLSMLRSMEDTVDQTIRKLEDEKEAAVVKASL
ncbi:MAG: hypothetical protein ACLUKQ_08260 [Peptococcaceae bacterium]